MADRRTNNLIGRDKVTFPEYRPDLVPWIEELIEIAKSQEVFALPKQKSAPGTLHELPNKFRIDNQGYFKLNEKDRFGWLNLQIQVNQSRNVGHCSVIE